MAKKKLPQPSKLKTFLRAFAPQAAKTAAVLTILSAVYVAGTMSTHTAGEAIRGCVVGVTEAVTNMSGGRLIPSKEDATTFCQELLTAK